jgi:hypothetical protein
MRPTDNPDRNFSADCADTSEARTLRGLLQSSEVADLLDDVIRERIGRAIAWAKFNSPTPGR